MLFMPKLKYAVRIGNLFPASKLNAGEVLVIYIGLLNVT